MLETSRYYKAVPVYLPVIESPRHTYTYSCKANTYQEKYSPFTSTNTYFPVKQLPHPDTRIRQLRNNNPFSRALPGQKIQSTFDSIYGDQKPKQFKPTRALSDFPNPFQRKVLVQTRLDVTTDYLKYINHDIQLDLFPSVDDRINNNDHLDFNKYPSDIAKNTSHIGSNVPIHPTPIFDPANQSHHDDVDLEELEKQINLDGQTFKLAHLKRATKL